MKGTALILGTVLLAGLSAEAAAIPSGATKCLKAYSDYKKKPGHKAFAMSQERYTYYYCGMVWSVGSVAAAKAGAMKSCLGSMKGSKSAACYIVDAQ